MASPSVFMTAEIRELKRRITQFERRERKVLELCRRFYPHPKFPYLIHEIRKALGVAARGY